MRMAAALAFMFVAALVVVLALTGMLLQSLGVL